MCISDAKKREIWDRNYRYAKGYYDVYGNLLVPQKYECEDGFRLGSWINTIRQARKGKRNNRKLEDFQIKMLDDIGMVWDVGKNNLWDKCYQSAVEYYNIHGDLLVPQKYVDENGIKLGSFINRERQARKENTRYKSSDEHVKMLDAIGMVWDINDELWNERYLSAKKYYEENGDLLVPQKYKNEDGFALGLWVANQRHNLILNDTLVNEERKRLLDDIGMVWDIRKDRFFKKEITKKNQNEIKIEILNVLKDMIQDMKCNISSMDDVYCINEMFVDELDNMKVKKK